MKASVEVCVFCVPLSNCYPRLSSTYFICMALSDVSLPRQVV